MKEQIITLGALVAGVVVLGAIFLIFYGMHAGETAAEPTYFNHGPQDPHDTQ
jgi:hypothetical protein